MFTSHTRLRPIARFTIVAVLLMALSITMSTVHWSAQTQSAKSKTRTSGSSRRRAPEFDLSQTSGKSVKSGDLKGNIVVVDLWAAWCFPCIEEIPNYNALAEKYKGKGVKVIGIAIDSGSREEVKAKVADLMVQYPILLGTDALFSDFGIDGISFPATLVLAKDWTVHHQYLGLQPNKKAMLEREIDDLLAEQ